jgi:hypothetical protein
MYYVTIYDEYHVELGMTSCDTLAQAVILAADKHEQDPELPVKVTDSDGTLIASH